MDLTRDEFEEIYLHGTYSRNILRRSSSNLLRGLSTTIFCVRTVKDIFADNLTALMESDVNLDTPAKVAAKAKWPRGKKAGECVSARNVDYAKKKGATLPSPTLDFIEAIAKLFNVEPWELITDPGESRKRLIDRLMRGNGAANDETDEPRPRARK